MGQQAAAGIGAVVGNGGLAVVPAAAPPSSAPLDVSVVMPCLNEAATLSRCIAGAQAAFRDLGLRGEVVVADNGSTDASAEIARSLGARVVVVAERGYGSALRGGIAAARADLIVMGDADDSYDFSRLEPFVTALRAGAGLVMGNRLTGRIDPGAMPWKHRWIGNPVLSALGRLFFRAPVGDFHCGLRGFTREAFLRMDPQTSGMEFASEMVIRAALLGIRMAEIPIVLRRDGRSGPSHIRPWRDGWRHLRFMLLLSPLWLFFIPGLAMLLGGLAGCAWLATGYRTVAGVELDVHTLLVMSSMCLVGYQLVCFGAFAESHAQSQGLHPPSPLFERWRRSLTVERGVLAGAALVLVGLALLVSLTVAWRSVGFGHLPVRQTMRTAIPATLCLGLGVQTLFTSFFLGILGLKAPARGPGTAETARGPGSR